MSLTVERGVLFSVKVEREREGERANELTRGHEGWDLVIVAEMGSRARRGELVHQQSRVRLHDGLPSNRSKGGRHILSACMSI